MKNIFLNLAAATISLGLTCSSAQALPPTTSPYFTDVQSTYNKDASAEAFRIVSIVSCYVRAMAPEKAFNVVGSSPYVALIDVNLCESDSQTTSGSGSVVQTKKYETALVIASVTNGVLDGKIWLKGTNANDTTKTWVSIKITGGPAKIPPFGEWEVNWCDGYNESTKECTSLGYAKVDPSGSRAYNYDVDGQFKEERAVVGSLSADMRSGGGKYRDFSQSSGDPLNPTDVAGYYSFDTTRLYQNQGNSERCLIPRSDEPGAKVSSWETWLYDSSTGKRLDVNSGFSIKDEAGTWGYAGGWGVSIGNRIMVPGETVYKVDSEGNRQATYTAMVAKGKLFKVENKSATLSTLDGVTLRSSGPKDLLPLNSLTPQQHSALSDWVNYTIFWDEASAKFYITGVDICTNQSGCVLQSLEPAVSYSISTLTDENGLNLNNFWAYQEGTNNSMQIVLAEWQEQGNTWARFIANSTSESVRIQNNMLVTPGETNVPADLICLGHCVDSQLVRSSDNGSIAKTSLNLGERTYKWHPSSGMLRVGPTDIDFTGGSFFNSGVLVADTDLSKLSCKHWDGSNQVDGYCYWNADSRLSAYYRWESGPDSWNQFAGLKDANQKVVTFEPPITVTYKVPITDSSAYKGKTVSIQYAGAGSLWIPGYCYNVDTGNRANCGNGTDWANEFNIPFDTTIGVVTAQTASPATNGKLYYAKTLKRAVAYPDASDPTTCNSLKASATSYNAKTLPTKADWKNPADPSSSNFIGAWRESTAPPLVIDGELQR